MAINVIKKKDNNKKEAKAKTPAKAAVAIAIATFKVDNIYKNNT